MARNDIRPIIKLKSTAGTGYTYVTRKNKRNNPDRITLKKYDPVVRKHVEFREEREFMAKKSKIAKNETRQELVARYAARRQELKAIIKNPNTPDEERLDAQFELNRQPRDASPCRVRNRDAADGRPRGYLRKFGLSRVRVREMAHRGELPGVRKSSW